jgi:hypothetical protein
VARRTRTRPELAQGTWTLKTAAEPQVNLADALRRNGVGGPNKLKLEQTFV